MRERFSAKENPLVFNFNYKLTLEEEKDLYFIANLMYEYDGYTEDEVRKIFSNPKALSEDISDMIAEFVTDDFTDYKKAVLTISYVLLLHFSR